MVSHLKGHLNVYLCLITPPFSALLSLALPENAFSVEEILSLNCSIMKKRAMNCGHMFTTSEVSKQNAAKVHQAFWLALAELHDI